MRESRRRRKSVCEMLSFPKDSSRAKGRFEKIGLMGSQLRSVVVYSFWNLSIDSRSTKVLSQKVMNIVLLASYTPVPDCMIFGMKYAVNFRLCSVSRSEDHDSLL